MSTETGPQSITSYNAKNNFGRKRGDRDMKKFVIVFSTFCSSFSFANPPIEIDCPKGDAGSSCSVGSDGWVRCTDGTSYKLLQGPKGDRGDRGEAGPQGERGQAGTSCRTTRNSLGQVVIRCTDGSEEVITCSGAGCWSFGAKGNVFTIPSSTTTMPNLSAMTPEESVTVPNFKEFDRNADLGFPGMPHRITWYAIQFKAFVEVGSCKNKNCFFRLTADDGALLYVNNTEVVNNDGVHAPRAKTGSVLLEKGWHALKIDYFQGPRTQIALALEVSYDEGVTYRLVRPDELKFQLQ
jgi:hypothetical protein